MTLRLSELYTSPQGEGTRTGIMTCFVRFAGCNMRCPGWPCDTQYAIDPALFRKDSELLSTNVLLSRVLEVGRNNNVVNVCLTGGEPFIQNLDDLHYLVKQLRVYGLDVEAFTNGSVPFPEWAQDLIHFTMDWKLPGSGEYESFATTRRDNSLLLGKTDAIKFVVKDVNDLDIAVSLWTDLVRRGLKAIPYVGAVWGEITDAHIVEYLKDHKLPWRLNVQVHKYIWPPTERGV